MCKKARKTCISIIMITVIMFVNIDAKAFNSVQQLSAFEYAVLPGTDAWNEIESFYEKVSVCRIDSNTLSRMTNSALVKAIVDYPLLLTVFAYNSVEEGVSNLANQCDALRELLTRRGGKEALARYYYSCIELGEASTTHEIDYGLSFIGAIVTQPIVFDSLSEELQEQIVDGMHLYYESNLPFFLAEASNAVSRYNIYTPNGSSIYFYDTSQDDDFSYEERVYYNNLIESRFSNITKVRDASPRYNCHTYAWYNTNANTIWIPNPSVFMTDGSYTRKYSAVSGYKVYYSNNGVEQDIFGDIMGNHSAIVYSVSGSSITVRSKWGIYGVYTHNIYNSPYSGNNTNYSYWG